MSGATICPPTAVTRLNSPGKLVALAAGTTMLAERPIAVMAMAAVPVFVALTSAARPAVVMVMATDMEAPVRLRDR